MSTRCSSRVLQLRRLRLPHQPCNASQIRNHCVMIMMVRRHAFSKPLPTLLAQHTGDVKLTAFFAFLLCSSLHVSSETLTPCRTCFVEV